MLSCDNPHILRGVATLFLFSIFIHFHLLTQWPCVVLILSYHLCLDLSGLAPTAYSDKNFVCFLLHSHAIGMPGPSQCPSFDNPNNSRRKTKVTEVFRLWRESLISRWSSFGFTRRVLDVCFDVLVENLPPSSWWQSESHCCWSDWKKECVSHMGRLEEIWPFSDYFSIHVIHTVTLKVKAVHSSKTLEHTSTTRHINLQEDHQLKKNPWTSTLLNFLHPLVISCLLGLDILLSTFLICPVIRR